MFHARTVMTAVSMLAVGLAAAASASSAQAHPATAKAANTTVTIKVANCEGCQVYVSSVMAADYEDVWEGPDKSVRNGEVSFKVPTDRTAGMSIAIDTPWDGAVPYQTMVALRYKTFQPGDRVSYSQINDAKRASGCWAGTTAEAATIKVKAKKVTVMGHLGPVTGTIAFAKTTQDYLQPMQRTWDGVLGTQDLFGCGPED